MNILVTGSNGQLGSELKKIAVSLPDHHWFFTDINELDISSAEKVNLYCSDNKIGVCINCAAYTAVDKAEDEPVIANLINAQAVQNLADACYQQNALLIHISTDYVFNGEYYKPYEENQKIEPVSAYGLSKARGEQVLADHSVRSVILRTSWLYSATGNNFVKTMIRLGKERSEIKVVADQIGTPTWAFDLAEAILTVMDHFHKQEVKEIYHFSNEGVISWYDFALSIMKLDRLACKVIPIESKDYPVKTKRPFYSVLNKSKFKKHFGKEIPYWRDSLMKCLEEIHGQDSAN